MFRNLNHFKKLLIAAACLAAVGHSPAGFAAEAGKFQFVAGDVKIMNSAGARRVPVKGEAFSAGDTIVTGATGSAQIRMSDGGLVAVRPETEMKLDQYVFNGREDGSERKVVSLIKGGFRAITGLIGNRNKDNYRILTPSATIGIRGTDHEPVVVPAGAKGGFQAGTYDRVYRGATIIETDKGKLIVSPNQVGFTPGKGIAPVLLPKIPDFYNTKPGAPDAAKDPQKDSKADGGGGDEKTSDTSARGTTVKSLSTLKSDGTSVKDSLKDVDTSATRLTSPLDSSSVKTLKSDVLTTPLSDTSLKSTLGTSTLRDTSTLKSDALTTPVTVPTTTLKSTEVLTVPTTTTTQTLKSPVTTTVTTPVTTVAPTTTISPKVTESVTVPTTTIRSTITTKP